MSSLVIDFSTLGGVVAFNVALTQVIISTCKVSKKWLKQLISWGFPMVISILAFVFQFGLFADYGTLAEWTGWVYTVVTGLGVGLVSNGVYDITLVQELIELIEKLFKKKETKTDEATAE